MDTEQDDWIDIDEAVKLTGKSKRTLMRWKKEKQITTRVVDREFTQRQRRTEFRRSDLAKAEGV